MTLALPLALLLVLPARAAGSDDEEWSPRLTAVSGEVTVFEKGSAAGISAEAGTPLEDGDRIETGADGTAEAALEPDSILELGKKTSFTVGSTAREDPWFSLDLGSLVAKLRSFAKGRSRLQVRSPSAVAAVRGTEFGLEVGADGETAVGVFDEGEVSVTSQEGGGETVLTAQRELVLRRGERVGRPHALERLKARRARLSRLRERRAQVRKGWKRLAPAQRHALRQRWREKMRERMKGKPPKGLQRLKERAKQGLKRKGAGRPRRR